MLSSLLLGSTLLLGQTGSFGNHGFEIGVDSGQIDSVNLGTSFVAKVKPSKEIKTPYTFSWSSLTPDICAVVDSNRGVMKPLRAGIAVLQAKVYIEANKPSNLKGPLFLTVSGPIKINPLLGLATSAMPRTVFVNGEFPVALYAFRDSAIVTDVTPVRRQSFLDQLNSARNAMGLHDIDESNNQQSAKDEKREVVRRFLEIYRRNSSLSCLKMIQDVAELNKRWEQIKSDFQNDWKSLETLLASVKFRHAHELSLNSISLQTEPGNKEYQKLQEFLEEVKKQSDPATIVSYSALNGLLADLPIRIRSLTPDILEVGNSSRSVTGVLEVANTESFIVIPKSGGRGRLSIDCGGAIEEVDVDVLDPVLDLTTAPGKGRSLKVTVNLKDKRTGQVIPTQQVNQNDLSFAYTIDGEEKALKPELAARSWTLSGEDSPGVHQFKASLRVLGRVVSTAEAGGKVRAEVYSIQNPPIPELIVGDKIQIPLSFFDRSNRKVEITEPKDVEFIKSEDSMFQIESFTLLPAPHISISIFDEGESELKFKLDGQTYSLKIRALPQLKVSTARVSDRMSRDLFGAQVAKEFIVRQIIFENRLNKVNGNSVIKDKDIDVYAATLSSRAIAVRAGRKPSDIEIFAAECLARNLAKAEGPLERKAAEDALRRHETIVFSGQGSHSVTLLPYNPVLFSELERIKGAIESRRSEDVFMRTFESINRVTTFLGSVTDLRDLGIPLTFAGLGTRKPLGFIERSEGIPFTRNPFAGDGARANRDGLSTLITELMNASIAQRDKQGKGLLSDVVLSGIVKVPSNAPVVRYLLIPRASFITASKVKMRIEDFWDESFSIGYQINTNTQKTVQVTGGG